MIDDQFASVNKALPTLVNFQTERDDVVGIDSLVMKLLLIAHRTT